MALTSDPNLDGVIQLTEKEAITKQFELIRDWEPISDVWAVKYGAFITAFATTVPGVFIHRYYRKKLKIGRYGYMSAFLPTVTFPAMLNFLFHQHYVTSDILLQKTKCSVCVELKAIAIQCALGIAYPILVGSSTNYTFANRYSTCRMPDVTNAKKMWNFHVETTKPLLGKISMLLALNVITVATVTYFQYKNFYTVTQKVQDIEEKYKSQEDFKRIET